MKKLLVLALVLGMVTVANAGLQLSVNGQTNGPGIPQEVTLKPSETILVDVTVANDLAGLYLGIEPVTGSGEWVVGTKHLYLAVAGNTAVLDDGGYGDMWWKISYPTPPGIGTWSDGVAMDVVFHCTGLGDVNINLYDPSGYTVIDSILVHQTPEPMTMLLLGLGGLFLRKK